MSNKKNINFVNDLKIRNLFPFYIENVNSKFFSSLQNVSKNRQTKNLPHFIKSRLDSDEIKKFWQFHDISNHDNIGLLINQLVSQMASKLGNNKTGLFKVKGLTKFEQNQYVQEKFEIYDFKIIGDVQADRRFIYAIDIDPKSYLFEFLEQIQIFFYLDEKKKLVSGGFSLNWGNDNRPDSDENAIEKVYLNSFIKLFVSKEIGSISINNMLGLMSESFSIKSKKTKATKTSNKLKNKNSIELLKDKWETLLENKILSNLNANNKIDKSRIDYYKNDLFFSVVNVILICLAIYEELRKYFTNKSPELYLPLLGKTISGQKEISETSRNDFEFLIQFLKKRFFHFGKTKIAEIQSAEDAIAALIRFDKFENESFGSLISSYEIIRNSDIPFLDEDDDIFLNSKDLKVLFLMIMKSEIFGINSNNHSFTKYSDLIKFIKQNDFKDDWKQTLDDLIDETICEWNYDYVSFINQKSESFIIKNNNPIDLKTNSKNYEVDQNRKIYNNYVWANVYTQTLIWMMKDIEEEISIQRFFNPIRLRTYVSKLESLQFDRYDSFYGISQVKVIVSKLDEFHNYNYLNKILIEKTNKEDKLYGKGKERRNIALAFLSTTVYGLLDFFTMVFSVLTVPENNPNDIGLGTENITVISIGSVFAAILISILIYWSIVPAFINYKKNKKNKV